MLKIKLARFGKKHQPHFRIVINEARDKRDGKYIAVIGHYAPAQQPKILDLDLKEYEAWQKKGAQPTDTVAALAERVKAGKPFEKKDKLSKKAKAKLQASTQADGEVKESSKAEPGEAKPVAKAQTETPASTEEKTTEPAETAAAA